MWACACLCGILFNCFYSLYLLVYSDVLFLLEIFLVVFIFLEICPCHLSCLLAYSFSYYFIILFISIVLKAFSKYVGVLFSFVHQIGFSSMNSSQLWSADRYLSCITFVSLLKIFLCYLMDLGRGKCSLMGGSV